MPPVLEPMIGRYLRLEIDGVPHRIYFEEAGRGIPLVCLHTAGADNRQYRHLLADPGQARLRMVHAAPELGDANLALNGKVVAKRAAYTDATQYWTLPPGAEELTVLDPSSKKMALGRRSVPLAAGTSTTAYVVGSRGERVKVVLVDDVLHTGRTVRAAVNELFDFGRPSAVRLAVLADRGGRELPFAADFTGDQVEVGGDEELVLSNDSGKLRFAAVKKRSQ